MINEKYNQIVDEAYENHSKALVDSITFSERNKYFKVDGLEFNSGYPNYIHFTKEEFINKIKTNIEFSEKWKLKIEERELSEGERLWICSQKHHIRFGTNDGPTWYSPDNPDRDKLKWMTESQRELCDYKNIPTKLITITYNNETIESYE